MSEPRKAYDAIVVGVGAHGSSILDTLARRGLKVLGIEKYSIAHANGSSHGNSRIFRTAYIEDPRYVPLLKRSLELWHELQDYRNNTADLTPATVINMTGGLMIGDPNSGVVQGTLASVQRHNLEHKLMTAEEIRSTWGGVFAVRDNEVGILDQSSGYIVPEAAIETMVHRAVAHGADLKTGTTVASWREEADKFIVTTDTGETFTAKKGILSVGAWANEVYGMNDVLHVERRVLHWFKPLEPQTIQSFSSIPVWIWQYDYGSGKQGSAIYGFPHQPNYPHSEGVKVARHGLGEVGTGGTRDNVVTEPNTLDRDVEEGEINLMRKILKPLLPGLAGDSIGTEVCMYTMTPNEDFLIDSKNSVVYVSPCSGHGFKMASVIGEIVADLVTTGRTVFDISFMSIEEIRRGAGAKWKQAG
ncbi:hypothetical protein TrVE_jg474 [Triparma verrucosa]|uniref:FAD dependent oxidoreductase domain-containing protein n=1 Tax=Triparma verrucosa TaxID=1606542 RepID=A0A9W7C641_9STRA|nr:hypothetical protein TrVE_jg474 [Triparma verrucosa]